MRVQSMKTHYDPSGKKACIKDNTDGESTEFWLANNDAEAVLQDQLSLATRQNQPPCNQHDNSEKQKPQKGYRPFLRKALPDFVCENIANKQEKWLYFY
ncbi:hypothetical protein [Brevibacillus agri]|uniref:hypothetical protein n=1 Tax=Brevibacillus agri TaxID=51101 RepID=UPI002867B06E|nr:hypothetical protein [Brevibacillus agri]